MISARANNFATLKKFCTKVTPRIEMQLSSMRATAKITFKTHLQRGSTRVDYLARQLRATPLSAAAGRSRGRTVEEHRWRTPSPPPSSCTDLTQIVDATVIQTSQYEQSSPHNDALDPHADEGDEGTEGDIHVRVVAARARDKCAQLGIAVGAYGGEDAAYEPDDQRPANAAGI